MSTKTQKNILLGILLLFAVILLIDRYYWAQISQWREDQATNLWLGYTRGIRELPVGLVSSRKLPNPNGMPLLGIFLSALPTLLAVSVFLGITQMILVLLVAWKTSASNWQYFLLAVLPSLSSVALRSISVEFWNQYIITLLNIGFIFWAIRFLERGSLWNLPPIVILMLFAPALYLAGIVNAIVMALLTVGMIFYRRPSLDHVWIVAIVVLFLVAVSIGVTWRPYFQNVSLDEIFKFSRIQADATGSFPLAFKHADLQILSTPAQILLNFTDKVYLIQVLFACVTFLYICVDAFSKKISHASDKDWINIVPARIVILCGLFILLAYSLAALLGSANWWSNQRADQTVQFLPLFLLLIFFMPFSISNPRMGKIIYRISNVLLATFVLVNLFCGFLILRDHLRYRGDVLTEADVALVDKMHVVDFIASDWKNHSNSEQIPVDYNLGGGKWDWVPEFGEKLTKWYPAAMTQGRSFDYELLRRYGLRNEQEGVQLRTFGNGRYLVNYAFEPPPTVEQGRIAHYIFGRLRVSVVEK